MKWTLRLLGLFIAFMGGSLILCAFLTRNAFPLALGIAGIVTGGAAIVADLFSENVRNKLLWLVGTGFSATVVILGLLTLTLPTTVLGLTILGPSLAGLFLMPDRDDLAFPLPGWTVHFAGAGILVPYLVTRQSQPAGVALLAVVGILQTALFAWLALRARAAAPA